MTPAWLASAALALALSRPPLVVPSSSLALPSPGVTASTFAGVPLAALASASRAQVLTEFARRCDAARHPDAAFADAEPGEDVNGNRRAQNQAPYDWQRDGRRVACKSAQLTWNRSNERWELFFAAIKLPRQSEREAAFDELLLAAYTPEGVHVFRHDQQTGVSTTGKSTAATGQQIRFVGPKHEPDWRVALPVILDKLGDAGDRLAFVAWQ